MNKTRILSLLCLLLCAAMLFCACKKDTPEEPGDSVTQTEAATQAPATEAEKQQAAIGAVNSIITLANGEKELESDPKAEMAAFLKSLSFAIKATAESTEEGSEAEVEETTLIIKDGVIYQKYSGDDEDYYFIDDEMNVISARNWSEDWEVYTLHNSELLESFLSGMDLDLPESVGELSFDLPEITADDFELKDGVYYVKKDYIKSVVAAVVDSIIPADAGEEAKTQAEEIKSQINVALNSVTLDLGIAVDDYANIVGLKVAFDSLDLSATIGKTIKASVDVELDAKTSLPTSFVVLAEVSDFGSEDVGGTVEVRAGITYTDGVLTSASASAKVRIPVGVSVGEDEVAPEAYTSVNVDLSFNLANIYGTGEILKFSFVKADVVDNETEYSTEVTADISGDGTKISGKIEMVSKEGETVDRSSKVTLEVSYTDVEVPELSDELKGLKTKAEALLNDYDKVLQTKAAIKESVLNNWNRYYYVDADIHVVYEIYTSNGDYNITVMIGDRAPEGAKILVKNADGTFSYPVA